MIQILKTLKIQKQQVRLSLFSGSAFVYTKLKTKHYCYFLNEKHIKA